MTARLVDWLSRLSSISGDSRMALVKMATRWRWDLQDFQQHVIEPHVFPQPVVDILSPFEQAVVRRVWRLDFIENQQSLGTFDFLAGSAPYHGAWYVPPEMEPVRFEDIGPSSAPIWKRNAAGGGNGTVHHQADPPRAGPIAAAAPPPAVSAAREQEGGAGGGGGRYVWLADRAEERAPDAYVDETKGHQNVVPVGDDFENFSKFAAGNDGRRQRQQGPVRPVYSRPRAVGRPQSAGHTRARRQWAP